MYEHIYMDNQAFETYIASQAKIKNARFYIMRTINSISNIRNPNEVLLAPSDIGQYVEPISRFFSKPKITLIDKHKVPLKYAKSKYPNHDLAIYHTSIEELTQYDIKVEIVFCMFGIHLIKDISLALKNFSCCLREGGEIHILTMSKEQEVLHPLAMFFGTRNQFVVIEDLYKKLAKHQFKEIRRKVIKYTYRLLKQDITIVFSKYSNSFLFTKPEYSLKEFHKYLFDRNNESYLNLDFFWTLISAKK